MANLQKVATHYSKINSKKSLQILLTVIFLYISFFALANYFATSNSWIMSSIFALLTGGILVRAFIIMHDCGHGTFFKKRKTRDRVGRILGYFLFTPYDQWTSSHAAHHQSSANLDKRGRGDIWTLTVEEYQKSSTTQKALYLFYRFPFVTFILGPFVVFFINHRFPNQYDTPKSKRNIHLTSVFMFAFFALQFYFFGAFQTIFINLITYFCAQGTGCFLFYVQHQYEDCYWDKGSSWSYERGALDGSSYLKLPKLLQWFTGNIGFHHIHHLNHKIPFYNLEKCFNENECFQNPHTLTLSTSLKCIFIKFFDEKEKKMITYREYKKKYPVKGLYSSSSLI